MITQTEFVNLIMINDIDTIENIFKNNKFDISINDFSLFVLACKYSRNSIVKLMLKYFNVNISVNKNWAARHCTKNDNIELLSILLDSPSFDYSKDAHNFIHFAIFNKNINVLKFLLKNDNINPSHYDNSAILTCIEKEDFESFEIILNSKHFNKKIIMEEIIYKAASYHKTIFFECLLNKNFINDKQIVTYFYAFFNFDEFSYLDVLTKYINEYKIDINIINGINVNNFEKFNLNTQNMKYMTDSLIENLYGINKIKKIIHNSSFENCQRVIRNKSQETINNF